MGSNSDPSGVKVSGHVGFLPGRLARFARSREAGGSAANKLKYSFQGQDADGHTLLRFDNAPYHEALGRHHRHTPEGDIEALEYTGLPDLIAQFENEVNEIYDRRTN